MSKLTVLCVFVILGAGIADNELTLWNAAAEGNLPNVNKALTTGANPEWPNPDYYGKTSLHQASHFNHPDVVFALLGAGSNKDIKDTSFETPIYDASVFGSLDAVNMLIGRGADVNIQSISGRTPVMEATLSGHFNITKVLLINGLANVNLSDKTGTTALHVAAFWNRFNEAKLLLRMGADTEKKDNEGKTPVDIAREKGYDHLANIMDNSIVTTISSKPSTNAPTAQPITTSPTVHPNKKMSTVQISNASNTQNKGSGLLIPGLVISIVIIVAVVTTAAVLYVKKRKNKVDEELPLEGQPPQQSGSGMGSRHDSENSLYGVVLNKTESQVPSRGSQHESENSLYGATVA
ncbi:unnamed protein product [Meganyctiphanes norvegica]|uniref:Ankyrin repeat domain-containing protein n=1 Tax=Meganyctiphanes norvegica TaxID=48144 RepID=A0AAV2SQ56_MEGNR